jgi:small subunit ribosomal protein S5
MNTCKAFFEAVTTQKVPDDIARSRGRKLVDLRKVYYDGNVY